MRRRIPVVLAVAVVLVAAACSGDDDEAAPARRRAAPTTTAATAPSTTATVPPTTTSTSTTTPGPVLPDAPADAHAAATAVTEAERTIHAAATPELLAGAARRQQVAYRAVAAHPEWDAEVHRLVPADLHAALDANVAAARELRALTSPRDSLPPWHIVAPAPTAELLTHYRGAEAEFGVPWAYLASIHLVETRMGRIRGPSSAGARGPMQFMPATWAAYGGGGDIESNRDAIFAAARYLKANGAPGDIANALWNYNHSDRYVRAVTLYAERMLADAAAYPAYWNWDVYYRLASGDVLLPVGWSGDGAGG